MKLFHLVAVLAISLLQAQDAIQIAGNVKQPLTLTSSELAKGPRASLQLGEAKYEGVWLHELLQRAGVPTGAKLRGKALATYVLAEARDGYQVLFSLAEIDPEFTGNKVLVADTMNGATIPATQGPFRLVTSHDVAAARAVRGIMKITVVQVAK